jgi:hypothetical protein
MQTETCSWRAYADPSKPACGLPVHDEGSAACEFHKRAIDRGDWVAGPAPSSAEPTKTESVAAPAAPDQAMKLDAGKTPLDLLPFESLIEIGKVLEFGKKKYAAHKWREGMAWSRLLGALLRHVFKWAMGNDIDPETGLHELAHAGCCVVFLLSYALTGKGTDDRVVVASRPQEGRVGFETSPDGLGFFRHG